VNDEVTSPCINAGDPYDNYPLEPAPNGNRINMGAYGNTAEASLKPDILGLEPVEEHLFNCYKRGQHLVIDIAATDLMLSPVTVSLTTLDGRTSKQSYDSTGQIVIDISHYQKGMIICTVATSVKTENFKILND
jgi:hypothetical protein